MPLAPGYSIPPELADAGHDDMFGEDWMVCGTFEVDGRDEEYEHVWDWDGFTGPVWTGGGYEIVELEDFEPWCYMARRDGVPVGFYMAGQLWVEEDHRGRGLAGAMVLASVAARQCLPEVQDIGFSEAGYAAHLSALRAIAELAPGNACPAP